MSHILLYGLNACKLKYNNANDINKFHPFAKKHKAIQTKVSSHNVGPLITFITLMLPASHKSCPLLFSIVTFTSIHQFVQNLFAVLKRFKLFGHGNPALAILRANYTLQQHSSIQDFPFVVQATRSSINDVTLVTNKHYFIYGDTCQSQNVTSFMEDLLLMK